MIRSVTRLILQRFGLELKRIPSSHRPLTETGGDDVRLPDHLDIDTVIDVGVAGGTPWLYEQFPDQSLILVEPLNVVNSLSEWLHGRDYEMHECAAGSRPGEVEINYDIDHPSLSSIMQRTALTTREGHRLMSKKVAVRPLDHIVDDSRFSPNAIGLKIDTEGYELEVLKGAVRTLDRCRFVVCEASIEKRFEDSYNLTELVVFMNSCGFYLSKVLRFAADENGVIRVADVLFERTQLRMN